MLTSALQELLFVSALMLGPFIIPVLLLLLGFLLFLIVDMVKNWKKRSVRITAGVAAVCVLLFAFALERESRPYSESAARRLYESHREAYDTVASYIFAEGGSYWTSSREEWPEEIGAELNEVLTIWSLRCGSPHAYASDLGWGDFPVILFEIYFGPEYDSGDGCPARNLQYLAYSPVRSGFSGGNSYTESLIHLTGDWYLYQTVNL